MADQKKDLTGLMDYAKALEKSGQLPAAPKGSVMEEQKIEKVEEFETLEEYGKSYPAQEPTEAPATESPEPLPLEPVPEALPTFTPAAENVLPSDDAFATTPTEPLTGIEGLTGLDVTPPASSTQSFAPLEHPAPSNEESTFAPGGQDLSALVAEIAEPAPEPITEPLRPAPKSPVQTQTPLEKVRQYSEQLTPAREVVPAAYPFSVLITGHLAPEEKERLLDLISRENMGIREIDLEPQLAAGKILIPRISEYAAVMIVSALRSTRARMRMGPSDSIFATSDTQDSLEEAADSGQRATDTYSTDTSHPAEILPITTDDHLPGRVRHAIVDVVTASAALKTLAVEAEGSPEYQQLLEALQRELKYKAFRKGATAVVSFAVQLTQMHVPSHYRVLVTGSAVRAATSDATSNT